MLISSAADEFFRKIDLMFHVNSLDDSHEISNLFFSEKYYVGESREISSLFFSERLYADDSHEILSPFFRKIIISNKLECRLIQFR